MCFGKARFQPRDDPQGRCGAFVVNLIVGASQLFTVIFCLVGWGWSIWWGVIMLKVASKYHPHDKVDENVFISNRNKLLIISKHYKIFTVAKRYENGSTRQHCASSLSGASHCYASFILKKI